jgi:tetratricopeptide (TPR) repeat protein
MKRKYGNVAKDDDETNQLNCSNKRPHIEHKQPTTSLFDSNTREYWNLVVNTMRAHNLYFELGTLYVYLTHKSIQFKEQIIEQLKQLQINTDENNVYYYLIQYGIMRLDEDNYDRVLLEQLTEKVLSMSQLDSSSLWLSNLYLMFQLRLGNSYANIEDFDKTFSIGETISKMYPNYIGIYSYMAFNLLKVNRYEEAIKNFDIAITYHDSLPDLFSHRAAAKHSLHRYNEAIDDFNKAIKLDPKDIWSIYEKGRLYSGLKQYNVSIECYTQVLSIDPSDIDALNARVINNRALGFFVPALRDSRQLSYLAGDATRMRVTRLNLSLTRILKRCVDPLWIV